jgi:hypothetical protein
MVKATVNWLFGGKVHPVSLPSCVVPFFMMRNQIDPKADAPLRQVRGSAGVEFHVGIRGTQELALGIPVARHRASPTR